MSFIKRSLTMSVVILSHCYDGQAQVAPGAYPPRFTYTTPAQADWWPDGNGQPVDPQSGQKPAAERISVARLSHQVPGKARAAFIRGLKFAKANEWPAAAEAFKQAVTIDQAFSEAYGNLGTSYSRQGLQEEAIAEYRRAIHLDPVTASHHANLGFSLLLTNQPGEAEQEAQTAVELEPADAKYHYLLGFLLARLPETRPRAVEHLGYAARELPEAHLVLAQLYSIEGQDQSAANEVAVYEKAVRGKSYAVKGWLHLSWVEGKK